MGNPYEARKRTVEVAPVEVIETVPEVVEPKKESVVVETVPETVPEGKVDDILAWVGTDVDRAVEALTAEEVGARRKTLIKALEEIIEGS